MSAQRPVLPIVFGAVAGSEEALRSLLRRNHDILAERLERLEGKVEMGLKAYWEQTNIFEYFVASHQELREMRDRLFRPGRTPTIDEKLELGKCFESLLARSRQRHTRRVIEALSPVCVDIRTVDFGAERMIMKLACLVEKDKTEQWEEAVRQAAFFFDDSYRFDYSGPWPPYHFAELDLEL
jgi:hypothetical protein